MNTQLFQKYSQDFPALMAKENLGQLTIKNYYADLQIFLRYIENNRISEIQEKTLLSFQEKLILEKFSKNAMRRIFQTLRRFFSILEKTNKIEQNYAKKIPTFPKELDLPHPPVLSILTNLWGQFHRAQKLYPDSLIPLRNKILFCLIYFMGAKVNNISLMTWNHLFLGKNPRVLLQEKSKKFKDPWTVPFGEFLIPLFLQYKDQLVKNKLFTSEKGSLLYGANAHGLLHPFLSDRGIQLIFEQWSKEISYTLLPRDLRQACICRWFQLEYSDGQIREWMGVAKNYPLAPYHDLSRELQTKFNYTDFDKILQDGSI